MRWGEFRVGELFEIGRGDISNRYGLPKTDKGINFICQNNSDNGFSHKTDTNKYKIFEGNQLIIGRQTGHCYYQHERFVTTDGVLVLSSKFGEYDRKIGLYLVTIIQKQLQLFGYNNTISTTKLNPITIMLPVNGVNGNNPDFEYMEHYIRKLEYERLAEVRTESKKRLLCYLNAAEIDSYELSDYDKAILTKEVEWGKFKIGELFDCIQQGKRLRKEDQKEGNLPFVMAGTTNNGVVGKIGNEEVRKFPGNSLTIDIFGNVFYRGYEFGAGDDTGVFWNKNAIKRDGRA